MSSIRLSPRLSFILILVACLLLSSGSAVLAAPASSNQGSTIPAAAQPSSGTHRILVILAQFQDQKSVGTTASYWNSSLFGWSNSVRSSYRESSRGRLELAAAQEKQASWNDGVVGWVTLPYNHPASGPEMADPKVVRDAIRAADPHVDFASFDADGDGYLSNPELLVVVVAAGYDFGFGGTMAEWPALSGYYGSFGSDAPTVDGKVVGSGARSAGFTLVPEWQQLDGSKPWEVQGHPVPVDYLVQQMAPALVGGATSAAASPTLRVPSVAQTGGAINVGWDYLANPTSGDWVGLFRPGGSDYSPISKQLTGGVASGTVKLAVPAGSGAYEVRLFLNNRYPRVAISDKLWAVALSATPASVGATGRVTVSWSGLGGWSSDYSDWIELNLAGATGAALERKTIDGVQSGSAVFVPKWGAGSYQFSLYRAHRSSPSLVALSNRFTVIAGR